MDKSTMVHVIIIDDIDRLALHVLRYLGHELGSYIGMEENKYDNNPFGSFAKDKVEPKCIPVEHGQAVVWWAPAQGNLWEDCLDVIYKRIEETSSSPYPIRALVDLRGAKVKNKGVNVLYEPKKVIKKLNSWELTAGKDFWLVSSYQAGAIQVKEKFPDQEEEREKRIQIWPKSPDTLWFFAQNIRGLIDKKPKRDSNENSTASKAGASIASASEPTIHHILVTGAGFEMRNPDQLDTFGMPNTKTLLWEMGDPFDTDDQGKKIFEKELENYKGFPYPCESFFGYNSDHKEVKESADDEELDDYWDNILQSQIKKRMGGLKKLDRLNEVVDTVIHERNMRDAFRRVILNYDWGFMNQSIYAARMNWFAWLTTNYTRFADRAIELARAYPDDRTSGPLSSQRKTARAEQWRVVGTANEARILLRENLHDDDRDTAPILFKLHGDVGLLHTMAIAGYDKEFHSPLGHIVDSLHDVYNAALYHLSKHLNKKRKPENPNEQHIFWHIVGHDLKDNLLVKLIKTVSHHFETENNAKTTFIIANKDIETPQEHLSAEINENKKRRSQKTDDETDGIETIKIIASEYMARLFHLDLLSKQDPVALKNQLKQFENYKYKKSSESRS